MRLLVSAIFILLASIFPLSSYLLSLSFFGAAHIAYELSYIYQRLSYKLPRVFLLSVMSVLMLLFLIKTIAIFIVINYSFLVEIICVLLLAIITLYFKTDIMVFCALLFFAMGVIISPIMLFIGLAFLHNLTPWGFLIAENQATKAWIIFAINPLIVFGLSFFLAIDPGYYSIQRTNLYLAHYLTAHSLDSFTVAFFATAVYLQLMHYYYVIKVLPKFCETPIKFNSGVITLFFLFGLCFLYDFQDSKKLYSLIAMVHAYLEIPLLLYLLPQENALKKVYS